MDSSHSLYQNHHLCSVITSRWPWIYIHDQSIQAPELFTCSPIHEKARKCRITAKSLAECSIQLPFPAATFLLSAQSAPNRATIKTFFLKKKENCLCLSPLSVPAPFQDDAPYAGPHSYFSTKKNLLSSRPTNAVIWRYIACFLWVPTGSGGCFSDINLYFAFRLRVSFTSKMQPWLQGTEYDRKITAEFR